MFEIAERQISQRAEGRNVEQPTLYHIDAAEVATQVACELEDFVAQDKSDPVYTGKDAHANLKRGGSPNRGAFMRV
jgi:hypothetical protein